MSSQPPLLEPEIITGQGNARWHLAARDIAAEIEAGHYAPGEPIQASDLAARHRAGKATIARALAELRALGYVERKGGRLRVAASPPRAQLRDAQEDAGPPTRSGRAPAEGNRPRAGTGMTQPGTQSVQLLGLLAAYPGGLTCAQAAELGEDSGLADDPAARLRTLKRYRRRMRALERAGLAARSGRKLTGSIGAPPVLWTITEHGTRTVAVACQQSPAREPSGTIGAGAGH